jgi:glycosyltransferase involved in cell wall biosynthesis
VTRVLLAHQPIEGGVARHVADLARGLCARGVEVVLCAPRRLVADADARLSYRELPMGRALSAGADAAAAAAFARLVRETRPDLVHAHSSKAGALARLARVLNPRVPVLYSPHGYAFAGHFERAVERRAYRVAEQALAPLATRVVCVCEAEARLARATGIRRRVRVVHNGLDAAAVARAADSEPDARMLELRRRGPVICALTLLRPGKGIETLLDSMPRVLCAHPDAQLAIVGGGSELNELRAHAAAAGIGESVHFLGPTARPGSVLATSDLFVHAAWFESFPYVILEAMALALPLVATDVGGVSEAFVDGESGLLVPARDSAALSDRICALLADERWRRTLGAAAHERVRERFTLRQMLDGLSHVYEDALT